MRRPLAAIDLGTNTVRILVAKPDPAAALAPLWADQTVTRLGEGLTERGTLAPAAAERTLAAVRRFRDRALGLGAAEVLLVATAGVRQARDGREFLARLRAEPGVRPRVVSGEEEAALTLLGASWGLGAIAGTFALVDIGGGSTEVLVAEGARVLTAVSLALGVVHLVERFFVHDPVAPGELAACRAYVDARFRDEAWDQIRPRRPTTLVATAGTPTTLAVLDLGLQGYDPVACKGTASARPPSRGSPTGSPRSRSPSAPGRRGSSPAAPTSSCRARSCSAAALAGLGLGTATVSDAGLREGILLDAVGWRPTIPPPGA